MSAEKQLTDEMKLWEKIPYLMTLKPNEMEQFIPGEAEPHIESVVKRPNR